MTENNLTCKSKAAAIAVLETLAADMGKGTKQDALRAIRGWVLESMPQGYGPETVKQLVEFFEGDQHDRLAREWKERGGLPLSGARWPCLWNEKTQKWEPEFPPLETP